MCAFPDLTVLCLPLALGEANLALCLTLDDNGANEHVVAQHEHIMRVSVAGVRVVILHCAQDRLTRRCGLVNKVNDFQERYPEWPLPASICVFSNFAATVKEARKTDFNITVVSACFPSSQSFLEVKLKEVEMAVEQGADEVDIVLALNAFLAGDHEAASEEIRQVRRVIDEVAGRQGRKVHLKVILETGLLRTPENIANASFLAMEAGADFIKTSTGKVDVNATPLAAYIMCECIAKYHEMTGKKIGFKPAGGISTAADALCYYSIVSSLLGKEWLNRDLFRFGVSRVANSILSAVEQKTVSYF